MPNRVAKNVSITPELDHFISAQIASGRYQNASEVMRAALRLLVDEERRREWPNRGVQAKGPNLGR